MEYLASTMRRFVTTVLALILLACHTMARPPYNMGPVIFTNYPGSYPGPYYRADPRMHYGPVMNGYPYPQMVYPQYGMAPGPGQLYMPSSISGYGSSHSSYGRSDTMFRPSRPLYPSSQSFMKQRMPKFRQYNNIPRKRFGSSFKKTGFVKKSTVLPKVITKQRSLKKRMPDVMTDNLANIMPHPSPVNQHHIMKKKRRRFQMVARAKSFPGILKGTALGINTV